MERGRQFYLTLAAGMISTAFIISGLCVPSHMVFELKPFARVVLQSGNLDNWTAESLHLDPNKFEEVKHNYQEYLKSNRNGDDSSDEDSIEGDDSDSSDSDMEDSEEVHSPLSPSRLKRLIDDSNSSSESSGPGESSDSSDSSEELTLEEKLQGVPIDQTIRLGLFVSRVCAVSQSDEETCDSVPVITGLQDVIEAAEFAERELTMPFWNNVRMESLFSLVAAFGGVVCLIATLKPCCDIEQTPLYLGAVSFFAAGVLAFVPVIRIVLMSADFRESLKAELNITTNLRMPWSVLLSAFGGTFALVALVSLVLGNWCRMTKRLYKFLSIGGDSKAQTEKDVMMHRVSTGGSLTSNGYVDGSQDNEKTRALILKT